MHTPGTWLVERVKLRKLDAWKMAEWVGRKGISTYIKPGRSSDEEEGRESRKRGVSRRVW